MTAFAPATVVLSRDWAPVALYVICFTPDPPSSSMASTMTDTAALFHPAAFGGGASVAVASGGTVSLGWPGLDSSPLLPRLTMNVSELPGNAPPDIEIWWIV